MAGKTARGSPPVILLRDGAVKQTEVDENGAEIDAILPPLNPFSKTQDRASVKRRAIEKLKACLQRFTNLGR